jgi:membrane-associated phospholipid phosphatase
VKPAISTEPGDVSYPSEHAAIAGAASAMLAHLYPGDTAALQAQAEQAAFSRLQAGVNYRSDIEAGLALGRAVAARVIARRALTDGSAAVWDAVAQPGRLPDRASGSRRPRRSPSRPPRRWPASGARG